MPAVCPRASQSEAQPSEFEVATYDHSEDQGIFFSRFFLDDSEGYGFENMEQRHVNTICGAETKLLFYQKTSHIVGCSGLLGE